VDKKQNSPLEIAFFQAIAEDRFDEVRRLVAQDRSLLLAFEHTNFGATPLTRGCFGNQLAMARVLLDLGMDPDRRSDWEMGPWSPLHCAAFRRDRELAEELLKGGATLDVHGASGLGWIDEVRRLLDADPARVNERGGDGCQPLHFADTVEVARFLLDRGADIDGRCVDHYSTPVQYLCSVRPAVACFLFQQGARPDFFSAIMSGARDVVDRLLVEQPSLLEARINQEFFPPGPEHNVHNTMTYAVGLDATPLHAATKANRAEMVDLLVRSGHPVDARGGYDDATPLHLAAWDDHLEAAQRLVAHGADLNARSGKLHQNSPAGWAIVAGSARVLEYLLDCGAERLPWFVEDARDGVAGRFGQFKRVPAENHARILARLS
jgi:ankyrin repeat protein